jgi:hypothetical protein
VPVEVPAQAREQVPGLQQVLAQEPVRGRLLELLREQRHSKPTDPLEGEPPGRPARSHRWPGPLESSSCILPGQEQ